MNDIQTMTWHYVCDIHEPEEIWYSRVFSFEDLQK